MVNGDWILLDNANLCSPSVLDRINSILEPERKLYLNESGTDRIIEANDEFRIIMAYDVNRGGEISRAMRNRSIEICILNQVILIMLLYFLLLFKYVIRLKILEV